MPKMTLVDRSLRVTFPYQVQYANPITIIKGERLNVGRADDQFPGWRWCTARDGREGWVPTELLSHEGTESTILQDYSARELEVHTGEVVVVEDDRHGWLLVRNVNGEKGWIPANRVHKP
jgi:uncharacterized protein YgiM (DUF1202 family)